MFAAEVWDQAAETAAAFALPEVKPLDLLMHNVIEAFGFGRVGGLRPVHRRNA